MKFLYPNFQVPSIKQPEYSFLAVFSKKTPFKGHSIRHWQKRYLQISHWWINNCKRFQQLMLILKSPCPTLSDNLGSEQSLCDNDTQKCLKIKNQWCNSTIFLLQNLRSLSTSTSGHAGAVPSSSYNELGENMPLLDRYYPSSLLA